MFKKLRFLMREIRCVISRNRRSVWWDCVGVWIGVEEWNGRLWLAAALSASSLIGRPLCRTPFQKLKFDFAFRTQKSEKIRKKYWKIQPLKTEKTFIYRRNRFLAFLHLEICHMHVVFYKSASLWQRLWLKKNTNESKISYFQKCCKS